MEKHSLEEGLHFETHGVIGEGIWFHLYECQHVTEGSYPLGVCLPIGANANIILCRHCWQQAKGMVAEDLLHKAVHSLPFGDRATFVKLLLAGEEPTPEATEESLIASWRERSAWEARQGIEPEPEPTGGA